MSVRGTGQPLVCFHGFGFDHHIWQNIAHVLQHKYCLYLVDLPGFGQSPCQTWDEFKNHLLPQLPPVFSLLGWSMGGLFATRLAIEHPLRVSHLLQVASSPYFIKEKGWPGIEKEQFELFYRGIIADPAQAIASFIKLQSPNNVAINHQFHSTEEGLMSGLSTLATWDFRDALTDFRRPVSYLFGRLDSIVPRRVISVMQNNYPHFSYLMLDNAAHMPFVSDEVQFSTWISDCIS